jgi:hypothetical protein
MLSSSVPGSMALFQTKLPGILSREGNMIITSKTGGFHHPDYRLMRGIRICVDNDDRIGTVGCCCAQRRAEPFCRGMLDR